MHNVSCKLSFIWGKMMPAAQETAPHIALRDCSKEVVKVKVTQSCPTLWPHGLYSPWNSPGQDTGVGSCSLLQWIFLIQEPNQGLLYCRRILYQLSYQGSPKLLQMRLKLTTWALLTSTLFYKYCALTNCATGVPVKKQWGKVNI